MSYSFSRDRTSELKSSAERQSNDRHSPHDWGYSPPESIEMEDMSTTPGFLSNIDYLKKEIESINANIDQIGNFHDALLESLNEQQWKQTSAQLDKLKSDTQQKNNSIKSKFQELENSNNRVINKTDYQMRKSQTAALKKRFIDTIQRYQDVERNYQMKYRQRIERQIRIVKPDASQDEVDEIIDADDTPQIFVQSLVSAGRQGQSRAVSSEVEKRHDDIKHIEQTIVELHQLFMDMQMMVEQQGETLDRVQADAEDTAVHIEEGNKQLKRAIILAKSTRTKKFCCVFLCIGICVMIAILVWWFGFNHVGVGDN